MAEIVNGGASVAGAELRVVDPGAGLFPAGDVAHFWSTFTYRRPGVSDLLVPDLIHLGLR